MRRVVHLDRMSWRVDASSVSAPPNLPGFVDITGVATRVGVFQYSDIREPGVPFLEWRPPDEVLDPDSLLSLLGVPFTIDHPTDDVSSANMQALTHGWVLKVWPEGDLVYTRIRIGTDAAKRAIEAGTVELSCGYSADLEEVEGTTPSGESYHAIQRAIRYNHLALVDTARAGPIARLRLDQLTTQRPYATLRLDSRTVRVLQRADETTMKTIEITRKDGSTFKVAGWLRPSIDAASKQRLDELATEEVQIGGVKLVLPKEMVEAMLATLGGGASAVAEPDPMATDELPEVEPEAETLDELAAPQEETKTMSAKTDKNDKLEAILARHRKADRQERSIERLAATILPTTYDYDRADCWTTAAAAVKLVDSEDKTVDGLAAKARKGDGVSAGRLLERLEGACKSHRDRRDRQDSADDQDGVDALVGVVTRGRLIDSVADADGEADVIPLHVQERKDRLSRIKARSHGRAPATK